MVQDQSSTWDFSRSAGLIPLIPALVVFFVFLPVIRGQFVWDDTIYLYQMPNYRSSASLWQVISEPFALSQYYFRPLTLLSFAVELRIWGANASALHITNLLLHSVNTGLVTQLALLLILRFYSNQQLHWMAWIAGLLYGLHPVMVESVAFISSRFDLLATTFLILALLADVAFRDRDAQRLIVVSLAFLLAAFSKESAIALILLLPAWHWATKTTSQPFQRHIQLYAALIMSGLVYTGIRFTVLGYVLVPEASSRIASGSLLQHLLLVGRSLAEYVLLILWPFTRLTVIHYTTLPIPIDDLAAWCSLLGGVALLGLIGWLLPRVPSVGGLIAAGLMALLPVLNLLPLQLGGNAFVAERFLTFPLVLFALVSLPGLRWLLSQRIWWSNSRPRLGSHDPQLLSLGSLPIAFWLTASIATVLTILPHWQSDLTLWLWASERAPLSSIPASNLSLAFADLGNYERALAESERAVKLGATDDSIWVNRGMILFRLSRYDDAQTAFEEAIALNPTNLLAWNNLAGTLREKEQLEEAVILLQEQVLAQDPNFPAAHLNLGIIYLRVDRPDLALLHLQKAEHLRPPISAEDMQELLRQTQEPERWVRLGYLLLENEGRDPARVAFEQARQLGADPDEVAAGLKAVAEPMPSGE